MKWILKLPYFCLISISLILIALILFYYNLFQNLPEFSHSKSGLKGEWMIFAYLGAIISIIYLFVFFLWSLALIKIKPSFKSTFIQSVVIILLGIILPLNLIAFSAYKKYERKQKSINYSKKPTEPN